MHSDRKLTDTPSSDKKEDFHGIEHKKVVHSNGIIEEGIFFGGELKKGKKIKYGIVEEGEFSRGLLISGKAIYSDNLIEEGEFSDGLLSKGKIILPDNVSIEGSDAISFEGTFDGNKLNGKITYKSGIIEEGDFINLKLINGKKIHTNGTIEEGEFNLLKLTKGKVTSPDGKVIIIDKDIKETNETKPVEEVKKHEIKTLPDGTIEEGLFSDSGKLIKGKKTYSYGTIEEGEFYRGHIIKGKIISPIGLYEGTNGILYKETFIIEEGDFDDYGIITGKITYPDGTIEEGNFNEQILIKGKKISPNGTIEEGDFNDRTLKKGKIILPSGKIINI